MCVVASRLHTHTHRCAYIKLHMESKNCCIYSKLWARTCVCASVCALWGQLPVICIPDSRAAREAVGGGERAVAVGLPPGCQLPGLCRLRRALFDCLSLHKSQPALNLKRRSSSTSTSFWRFFYVPFFSPSSIFHFSHLPNYPTTFGPAVCLTSAGHCCCWSGNELD